MKKIITLLFLSYAATTFSQTNWTTAPAKILKSEEAKLGTKENRSLSFVTNDSLRFQLDSIGTITFPKLGFDGSESEIRFLYVDQHGALARSGGGNLPAACGGTSPWLIGGNTSPTSGNALLGPCSGANLILQANSKKAFFLTTDGKIGIGENNDTPLSIFDISNPALNPSTGVRDHLRIYGDNTGIIESTADMNLYYNNDFAIGEGNNQTGSNERFRIDNSTGKVSMWNDALIGGNSTTNGNATIGGNATITHNAIINGNVGIGTNSPLTRLHISDNSHCEILVASTSGPSGVWVSNNSSSYAFQVDATGIGRIVNNINSPTPSKVINFIDASTNSGAQVWIGQKPTSVHTDFDFAVGGKIVAESIYVTLNCNWQWADYVFDKSYKLPKLSEVESYYKTNKHLPEIPSAKEIEEKGINVAEINTLLVKKVEELTLYMVELNKKMEVLEAENKILRK